MTVKCSVVKSDSLDSCFDKFMKAESNVKRIASYFSLTPPLNSFKEARSIDQIVRIFFSQKGKKNKNDFCGENNYHATFSEHPQHMLV